MLPDRFAQVSKYSLLLFLIIGPDFLFIRVSFLMTQRLALPAFLSSPRCPSIWRNAALMMGLK